MTNKQWTVLGIETSCDETAAAIVRGAPPGPGTILSNVVVSQLEEHRPFGGVVPEIAARAHVEMVDKIVAEALAQGGVRLSELDAVAATAGPGLIGGVMVGLLSAKALALATGKPLIAANHLEAHALTARLTSRVEFPYLLLLISGGHCQLLAVDGVGRYRVYGATIDDAVGEAFDKTAKLLGLPYPGGPEIERLARVGQAKAYAFPRPMLGREKPDFSFSGLKTAIRHIVEDKEQTAALSEKDKADVAASFQSAVTDILSDRAAIAMGLFRTDYPQANDLKFVLAGGVAANQAVGSKLSTVARQAGFALVVPPPALCTDNGAMVAWAGLERLALGLTDGLDCPPLARWPLESLQGNGSRPGRESPAGSTASLTGGNNRR